MTFILVKHNDTATERFELAAGEFKIGRADDNDLPIADRTVSSHHARIYTYLNACYIEDLDSLNGTWINGKRVQRHTVHPGDVIRVGQQTIEIGQ